MRKKLLFLIFGLFSFASIAQNFVVSGAGSAVVNGTYSPNGTSNGYTKYSMTNGSGTFDIVWMCSGDACSNWHIVSSGGMIMSYYVTNAPTSTTPPSTGWFKAMFGSNPIPTVLPEGKTINYSKTLFVESNSNDGSIAEATDTLKYNGLNGDSFTGTNGDDFLTNGKASISNLPAGLTATLKRNSGTNLILELSGKATLHTNANTVNNLSVTLDKTAFTQNDASVVTNATFTTLKIQYRSALTVAASGADYTSVTAAIAAALDYDIITIAAGTYTEAGITFNKQLIFKGAGAKSTIIQANALANTATDRVFNVNASSAIFYDLTIQNGKVTAANANGGGVFSNNSLEFYNCIIKQNIADGDNQGAMCVGGGIYGANVIMFNCLIDNNKVQNCGNVLGGGVYLGSGKLYNCTFVSNEILNNGSFQSLGGGLHIGSSVKSELVNCTFTGNTAKQGGGIYFTIPTLISKFKNIISYGNTASIEGSDLYRIGGTLIGQNCIIGNSIANTGNVFDASSTNISSADPLLATLADNGGESNTVAIQVGSPAINAGIEDADVLTYDQRGYSKVGVRDIGAFEFGGSANSLNTKTIQSIDKELISVFPNPSNGEFTISSSSFIEKVKVQDLTGRLLMESSSAKVNIENEKPGIYFFHIETINGTVIKEVIKK